MVPRTDARPSLPCCSEPFQCTLRPAADVQLKFISSLGLKDFRQTDEQRAAACRAHWGGAVFRSAKPGSLAGQQPLTMAELVEAVRASCPYQWGGTLSLRVNIHLRGGE